jgi:hypothetical protein
VVNAFMWPARELMDLADLLVGGLMIRTGAVSGL